MSTFFTGWALRIALPMVAGAVVLGYLSAVSDNVYSQASLSSARWFLYAIAGIANDFAVWLALASFVAWRCGARLWQSVAWSILFSMGAIAAYLVWSPILAPGNYMVESPAVYAVWGVLALAGGAVGGLSGHLARHWPAALLPVFVLAIYRVMSGHGAWSSTLGAAHHVALVLIAAAVAGYWIVSAARWARRHRASQVGAARVDVRLRRVRSAVPRCGEWQSSAPSPAPAGRLYIM